MERGKHTEYEIKLKESIAKNIRKLLDEKKWSQKKLSSMAEVPTSTISDYVKGNSLALPGNVEKIARAFGVTKEKIDPSFGDNPETASSYEAKIQFFLDLEKELGVDLSNIEIQKSLKKAAKIFFSKED